MTLVINTLKHVYCNIPQLETRYCVLCTIETLHQYIPITLYEIIHIDRKFQLTVIVMLYGGCLPCLRVGGGSEGWFEKTEDIIFQPPWPANEKQNLIDGLFAGLLALPHIPIPLDILQATLSPFLPRLIEMRGWHCWYQKPTPPPTIPPSIATPPLK